MKKRWLGIGVILYVLLWTTLSFGAWTLTPSIVTESKHYLVWRIVCTSDGNALTATDIVQYMDSTVKARLQGLTNMIMTVVPGTGSVAPNGTINVTWSDRLGISVFAGTGYSNSANTTGINLSTDYKQYLVIYDKFFLTINDIGDSGDQVTLYIEAWIE